MAPLSILVVLKCLFALSTCVQLHIHRVDNRVQHMSPVMHGSSSDSPLLSRDASAAIGYKLTAALSDLWLFMFGAGAVYSMLALTTYVHRSQKMLQQSMCLYTQEYRDTHKPLQPVSVDILGFWIPGSMCSSVCCIGRRASNHWLHTKRLKEGAAVYVYYYCAW